MTLNKPIVLITGGQGDLAMACVQKLEKAEYQVLHPGKKELDVTSSDSVQKYFSNLKRLDILINNAGIVRDHLLIKLSETDWNDVLDTNLKGSFYCARAALAIMTKQRQGHLIHISSWAARYGQIGQTNYAASKAALFAFSQSIAKEYGKRNIQSNVVLPGYLKTKITKNVPIAIEQEILNSHSLPHLNTINEASSFILNLMQMKNVSGQIFQLDSRMAPFT